VEEAFESMEATEEEDGANARKDKERSFSLYHESDERKIHAPHNLVRRDILECFVVADARGGGGNDAVSPESVHGSRRVAGRVARYAGTVGLRCRHCKDAPAGWRTSKAAVYPRTLGGIYLACVRFQRDHVRKCAYIPKELKEEYSRLKNGKGLPRGKKKHWVTSAVRRGLRNGDKGIVYDPRFKC